MQMYLYIRSDILKIGQSPALYQLSTLTNHESSIYSLTRYHMYVCMYVYMYVRTYVCIKQFIYLGISCSSIVISVRLQNLNGLRRPLGS